MSTPNGPSSRAAAWVAATRPRTWPAGPSPVLVGAALAWHRGYFDPVPTLAAAAGALLIQIGTNLANDYYDFRRGADEPGRLGPPRAAASGWLPARAVLVAAFASFGLAALVGLYLVWLAGWPILAIGLASLASGYAYTGGPYPLGYHGWGDVFVFVFFGPVAVAGTYFVIAQSWPADVLTAGAALGCWATAILVVNNLRDLDTDRRAGKHTLAVRLGPSGTRTEYAALLLVPYAVPAVLYSRFLYPVGVLAPLATLPLALWAVLRIHRSPAAGLNGLLARTAQLMLLWSLLLVAGLTAGAWWP